MSRWPRIETETPSLLVLCLAGIGDAAMGLPAVAALRGAWPDGRITVVTRQRGVYELFTRVQHANDVVHFDFVREGVRNALRFLRGLRRRRFDGSLLAYPANRPEYNVVHLLAGARIRASHRYRHWDGLCLNGLGQRTVAEDDTLGNAEENLRLVACLTGAPAPLAPVSLELEAAETSWAHGWLRGHDLLDTHRLAVHAGCSTFKNHVRRRWPPERFVAVARGWISCDPNRRVLVFGGPEERALKQAIATAVGERAVPVDAPSLLASAALLQTCAHFVTNDSGLMHVAGLLRVPTTAVFGPTNPRWTRLPDVPRTMVTLGLPCQPCFYHSPRPLACRYGDFRCLNQMGNETVMASVVQRLAASDTDGMVKRCEA